MASVEIIKCKGCGANLSPEDMTCGYCHSKNIFKINENPFNINQKLTKQYINHYKLKVESDPMDLDAIFSLGLFYLNLKLFDLAIKSFYKAMKLNPNEPELHYYLAISLIKGRRPMTLSLNEIKEIEHFINSAIYLGNKAKYYYLAAIINFDFYVNNGLKIPQPSYEDLLNSALLETNEPLENKIILENVIIRDEMLIGILTN